MRRLRSTDGVEVAVHDLGGARSKPDLLLAHATGFCAQVYSRLAVSLSAEYRCWGLDLRGHGLSRAPDGLDFAWEGFGHDVLAAVAGLGLNRPVAVGHSCGGAAVLLAEAMQPGTFSALWCYEPIVWPDPQPARARAEALAAGARRRRARFSSAREAYLNFASKPPLSTFSPAAIRAYVDHGFAVDEDGSLVLRCRPDVEAAVYLKAAEGDRFTRLADVTCPVVIACGGRTDAVQPALAERIAGALANERGGGRVRVFDRLAHFGPLEDPAPVAEAILDDLR